MNKYTSDLHTHTIASGHAYTTLLENIEYCATTETKGGIVKILGVSDHGPKMPGAPHHWYFGNLKVLPRFIQNILVLKGCEANILTQDGVIDLPTEQVEQLDYMIASLHEPVIRPEWDEQYITNAIINAIEKNKKVEIIGHLGNPNYNVNYRKVVEAAKKNNVMIEINNSSLAGSSRVGSNDNCKEIAKLCKEIGTKVIMSSDAHICYAIGDFLKPMDVLKEIDMPEHLIMNEPIKLITHLKSKGSLVDVNIEDIM